MTCATFRLVDRHFSGAIRPAEERDLRAHLPTCDACRERYERRALLASIDPDAPKPQDRLAVGLGLRPRAATVRSPWLSGGFTLAATAVALVLFLRSSPSSRDGYVARGASSSHIVVYRIAPGAAAVPAPSSSTIAPDDELAFAYVNGAGRARLLVFGVDEHRHVYWYHPAWTDAASDPPALPIASDAAAHELTDAVRQPLDGAILNVYAVFTDLPLTPRQIEADLDRFVADAGAPVVLRIAR